MKRSFRATAVVLGGLCACGSLAAQSPDARELAAGLAAVERVRDAHRIWPEDNVTEKPALDSILSPAALEARVLDVQRRTAALHRYWGVEAPPEALQAELDRMARETRDPSRLLELFDALGRDAQLAAEVLARPAWVERQLRTRYAFDARLHGEVRQHAESALARAGGRRGVRQRGKLVTFERAGSAAAASAVVLDDAEFDALARSVRAPDGAFGLEETEQDFVLSRTVERSEDRVVLDQEVFAKRSFEDWWGEVAGELRAETTSAGDEGYEYHLPSVAPVEHAGCNVWDDPLKIDRKPKARYGHSAVWTGSEMLVWGGTDGAGHPNLVLSYDPATDTWRSSAPSAAEPPGRTAHTAIWTGTEMIVWGGTNPWNTYMAHGGRYDPASDTWTPVSGASPAPWPRVGHTATWTGPRMVVWGGRHWNGDVADGGQYDPLADTWTPMAVAGAPQPRRSHSAVWTSNEMIVFGGAFGGIYLNSLGRYQPDNDTWLPAAFTGAPPSPRAGQPAVWTGSRMVVWGGSNASGYPADGGRFDPQTSTWLPVSMVAMPAPRAAHVALWAPEAERMIVWGGSNGAALADGALYDPVGDTWQPVQPSGAPTARRELAAVWTGSEVLVWGGTDGTSHRATGGRYDVANDLWIEMTPGVPAGTTMHTAVWTGNEMIVWGGLTPASTQAGGAYDPATANWTPLPIDSNTPTGRYQHVALWTGTEMLIWGGRGDPGYFNDGGAYDPLAGTWRPILAGSGTPSPRALFTGVWTGSRAIFWGGEQWWTASNAGALYDPATDTWQPTSTGSGVPSARYEHTAVWTGDEMIVWGGCCGASGATGAAYSPIADSWRTVSALGAPSVRYRHVAVWDGQRMLVGGGWSGFNSSMGSLTGGVYLAAADTWSPMSAPPSGVDLRETARATALWTGSEMLYSGGEYLWCAGWSCRWYIHDHDGRYDPATNSWSEVPRTAYTPAARRNHTAVWTGDAMLVWGGTGATVGYRDDGGIFSFAPPVSPDTTLRLDKTATVDLTWEACGGASGYTVLRCDASAGPCLPVTPVAAPAEPALSESLAGPSYFYLVEAENSCGMSP